MHPPIRCLSLLITTFVLGSIAFSAEPQKIRQVEGITEYELENGLTLLLFPDVSRPTVTVNLTILVGSRHEGYGEGGMAHLLEHMVFKGTPMHPKVPKALQDRGARFNGTTWVDRTNYYETLPSSDENLEFAIRLEADRMVNSFIRAEDLASEMTIVRNEFEQGENEPVRVLRQRMQAAAYHWHNYGKSTIGNRSDIERVPITKLRAFYRKYYQPDNAVLVIAGSYDESKALEYTQKYFGTIPRPERVLESTYTEEPSQDGERSVILRRAGDVGVFGVDYHIPAGAHSDFAAITVLANVLTSEPSGRLYKSLVQTKMAEAVGGGAQAWHDPGLFRMLAIVRNREMIEPVRDAALATIDQLHEAPVTEKETERAKRQILKQRELDMADTSQVAVELSEWAAQGDWRLYLLHRDRIEQVTAADVQAVADRYLRPNNRVVGLYFPTKGPERVAVPQKPDLALLLQDFQGRKAGPAGEVLDPDPAAIEARTLRGQLPGGIKTALLPKKTRGAAVHLRLTLRFGNAQNMQGKTAASSLLPQLMVRGTKQLSYQELQDELDRQQAALSGMGGMGAARFTIQTKRDNLLPVLALLRQILREPTLASDEFELLKRQRLAMFEMMSSRPAVLAQLKSQQLLNPYPIEDVRYVRTIKERVEDVDALTLDQVQLVYNDYLGAQAGELAIVGDFDPGEVTPVLEEMFAGWASKTPYERIKDELFDVAGRQEEILTPDKENAAYAAGMMLPVKDSDPDFPGLLVGNYILGAGSLSSRLGDRVRQQEGLSYGVNSSLSADPFEPIAQFSIRAISNPANMPKVITVIKEEVAKLLADGVETDELERAQEGFLQRQRVSRSDESRLVGLLQSTLYEDRTMEYYTKLERQIQVLTETDVVSALRKYLDPDRLVVVIAGDFENQRETHSAEKKAADSANSVVVPDSFFQQMIQRLDKDNDGTISRDEAAGPLVRDFKQFDTNSDDSIDFEELKSEITRLANQTDPS